MKIMCCSLFVCLLLAHFMGDFLFQTDSLCRQKQERWLKSWFLYVHTVIIALLSLLALGKLSYWPVAVAIGVSHLIIDAFKNCIKADNLLCFVIDQFLHIVVLVIASIVSVNTFGWTPHAWLTSLVVKAVAVGVAVIVCWKPANLFIKYTLQSCKLFVPGDDTNSFHAGKLIGTLERWLILAFMLIGRYEAIGFLIAAKSIIRFGEKDKDQTEYFLAGTLLSISVAVVCGLLLSKSLFVVPSIS